MLIDAHGFAVQTFGFDRDGAASMHMDREHNLVFSGTGPAAVSRKVSMLAAGEAVSTYIGNFCVSADGSRVAVANHNGRGVNIHELPSGRRLYSLPDDPGSIWWLAWHPDGRHLAVSRGDGDISLWNLNEVEGVFAEAGLASR